MSPFVPVVGGWRREASAAPYRPFSELAPQLSEVSADEQHLIVSGIPIMWQGHLQSCVANATCDAFEILGAPALSRLCLYWLARNLTGDAGNDIGTYVRSAMSALAGQGACLESLWPYDVSKVNERPSLEAIEAAYDHRIRDFYRIDTFGAARCDDMETAVRANHPVVGGVLVGQSFVNFDGSAEVVWHAPQHPIGGHAVVFDGVRRINGNRHFRIRNSWGSGWGQGGFAWAAEDWITDAFSEDFWVATAGG